MRFMIALRMNSLCALALITVMLSSVGCSTTKFAMNKFMVPVLDNSREAALASNDIATFRDAAPANLFLIEGLIRTDPGNRDLRINAAILYFSHAFAFIEESRGSKEKTRKEQL